MADSGIRNPVVMQLEGEDFFTRFKLQPEQVIAQGVCGDIVKAIPLEKPEARRVVKKFTLLDDDTKDRNMRVFLAEVQFMQSFSHPYLMKCIIAAECTDYLAICMYYYPRGTLACFVGELSPQLSEICVAQVACALRYMHKNHVAHLDVKLENIFIDSDGNAILGDFGLSEKVYPNLQTLPKRKCGGTRGYFAPEWREAEDDKKLNPYKLDSYSLGVVLWALVLKRNPNININYYIETTRKPDLPLHIRGLLLKLLERNPARRLTVNGFLSRLKKEGHCRHIIDNY